MLINKIKYLDDFPIFHLQTLGVKSSVQFRTKRNKNKVFVIS